MFTLSEDLTDSTLASHLVDGWRIAADAVETWRSASVATTGR